MPEFHAEAPQATVSWGLAQGPYAAARVGVEPTTGWKLSTQPMRHYVPRLIAKHWKLKEAWNSQFHDRRMRVIFSTNNDYTFQLDTTWKPFQKRRQVRFIQIEIQAIVHLQFKCMTVHNSRFWRWFTTRILVKLPSIYVTLSACLPLPSSLFVRYAHLTVMISLSHERGLLWLRHEPLQSLVLHFGTNFFLLCDPL